ncbi:transmembrane protein, putative (macronuclear) [Tetrahymena thermophila SB210]|uniref:Transmembrane protein, putative n=1 Tax=Tetrahymena thermophila (strain SB210) TaxID=312017 RepID=I7MIE5_TETTS|nr:transmembrane protein, putative [Tetrahymena thermophila SB210]EAR92942.4 transmembrane protein, putative [Tetrahymena thermophila SB210]|eukprot:XP_001013187.4 transmembrane protein, putative [Tetrahymena thermophila SB210]
MEQSQISDQDQQTDQNQIISCDSIESNEITIQKQEQPLTSNTNNQDNQFLEDEDQELIIAENQINQQSNENEQQNKRLSFDEAQGFLKELLKAYYINKYQSEKSGNKILLNKQTNTDSYQKKSLNYFFDIKKIIGIIFVIGIVSSIIIGCLYVKNQEYQQIISQKEQELHNLKLSHTKSIQEIQKKYERVERLNVYLKKLAELAVNEEKRNQSQNEENTQDYHSKDQQENNSSQNSQNDSNDKEKQNQQEQEDNGDTIEDWVIYVLNQEDDNNEQMSKNQQQQETNEEEKNDNNQQNERDNNDQGSYRYQYKQQEKQKNQQNNKEQQQNTNQNGGAYNFFKKVFSSAYNFTINKYEKVKKMYDDYYEGSRNNKNEENNQDFQNED